MNPGPFFCLLLLSHSLHAAPTLYRWQDNEGQTHFSDTAPTQKNPSLEVLNIDGRSLNAMPAIRLDNKPPLPRKTEKTTTKSRQQSKPKNTRQCQKFQRQLDNLRSRMRLGYSAKQAPRLLQRERALNESIYQCKKNL